MTGTEKAQIVLKLLGDLGYGVSYSKEFFGVKDAFVVAKNGDRCISVSTTGGTVRVSFDFTDGHERDAEFIFRDGEPAELLFARYTSELFNLARKFGKITGHEI